MREGQNRTVQFPIEIRQVKLRLTGLIIDKGMGIGAMADILQTAGECIVTLEKRGRKLLGSLKHADCLSKKAGVSALYVELRKYHQT